MEEKERLRIEAEEEEKRGRERANKGDFVSAKISFENAKQLWEKVGDSGGVEFAQKEIERMDELWKWRKKVE